MSRLYIIRASAGSGKTQRLTRFFLELLLKENLDYFKSILGVTFTNKATEQMKHRIIEQLHLLAGHNRTEYYDSFIQLFKGNESRMKEKSAVLLRKILHEYSWFSIETIDTFYQRIIRAFTRELGIIGNYTVEIDTHTILQYAVDQLLDTLEDHEEVFNWLVHFSENKISEGRSWNIQKDLTDLGNELFKEQFLNHSAELHACLDNREMLRSYRDRLFRIVEFFEKKCRDFGRKGLQIINEHNLKVDDFFRKGNGAIKFFEKLERCDLKNSKGELITKTALALKLLESPYNWPSSDTSRKTEIIELVSCRLLPLFSEIAGIFDKEYKDYVTALVIRKNFYTLGILIDIENKIRQYRLEKNVFILSDAPQLLARIINQNDAPFIYEKMGNRYAHFLIDEFQDTSILQWSNFKPLISNSLSQAKECLIVGDVKQSIYRWRNGDWDILARQIYGEYPEEIIHTENLDINWRSSENIVHFNNTFFSLAQKKIVDRLQLIFNNENQNVISHLTTLGTIYNDISQTASEKVENKGTVMLRFYPKQTIRESPDYYIEPLLGSINSLLEKGYSQGDIALLVRDKKEGKLLADVLIAANNGSKLYKPVNVISEESLFLSASNAANMLIAALQYLNAPGEDIYLVKLMCAYKAHITGDPMTSEVVEMALGSGFLDKSNAPVVLPPDFINIYEELCSLPLYELLERLIRIFQAYKFNQDVPYIHALLDLVHDYSLVNIPGIQGFLDYWEEEGKLKSIPAAESLQAVRILTVHKAKGLEFKAVLIPFCNWDLDQKTNSIFWVKPPQGQFDFLPMIPLNYTRSLQDTHFAGDYFTEMFKSYVDNLNLLYVAFTRAINTLIVFSECNDGDQIKIKTVGDLLYQCIPELTVIPEIFSDKTQLVYQIGSMETTVQSAGQSQPEADYIHPYSCNPATSRIFFNPQGYEYFQDSILIRSKRIRGKVLHSLLASVRTFNELDRIVQEAVFTGLISKDEGYSLEEHFRSVITDPMVQKWFDGTGVILTEWDILIPGESFRRPDRVVIWPDVVHVIDYKFSHERHDESHRRQIREYMIIISELENKKVHGFIWYVDKNEIVEIGE